MEKFKWGDKVRNNGGFGVSKRKEENIANNIKEEKEVDTAWPEKIVPIGICS